MFKTSSLSSPAARLGEQQLVLWIDLSPTSEQQADWWREGGYVSMVLLSKTRTMRRARLQAFCQEQHTSILKGTCGEQGLH